MNKDIKQQQKMWLSGKTSTSVNNERSAELSKRKVFW